MADKNRRDRIAFAYGRLVAGQRNTEEAIAFVHARAPRKTLSNFLDTATEKQISHLEGLLNVRTSQSA